MRLKNTIIIFACLFVSVLLQAQQEAQFTQFMFNKLALNPAYAGNSGVPSISILHRSQWVGLEGAPQSQVINFHMPLKSDRVGLGMSILHDELGPTNAWAYQLKYSYRVPVAKGKLAIGLQGSMRRYQVYWSETNAIQNGDRLIMENTSSKLLPNFGVGLYYQQSNFYLGASIPNLLKGDLSFYEGSDYNEYFSQEVPHYYLMGGLIIKSGENTKIKPAMLIKYAKDAPVSVDINAMVIFFDKFWLGSTYRMGNGLGISPGESIDAIVQYQITTHLRVGAAYDYTLSKLRSYQSGSYEIMLDYGIFRKDKVFTNPRFF